MFAKRKRGIISLLLALFMLLSPIQALFAENAEGNTAYGEQAQDLKDIGEGSDHLTESEQANPAPIIEDNKPDPYLGDIAPKGLRSRGTQLRTPNPGAVELSKTVEAVPGKLNTFKVTLRMEATDREQKNDIVLVIDTSGSMKDNGRMEKAKEAAISFVNRLLDAEHPNTRIALVSFESKAYLKKN